MLRKKRGRNSNNLSIFCQVISPESLPELRRIFIDTHTELWWIFLVPLIFHIIRGQQIEAVQKDSGIPPTSQQNGSRRVVGSMAAGGKISSAAALYKQMSCHCCMNNKH
jgi:hypothetical protein